MPHAPPIGAIRYFQTNTITPPEIMPARAPHLLARFQNRANRITGPNAAPKPAHAKDTTRNTELSFPCEALGLRRQACFHPLKLLSALSQGLRVCEHTRVLEADGHILRTARGTVTAESILFTCHFPFVNVPGYFFIRQHQERSYVLALEGILPLEHYYLGTGGSAFSLRSSGKYLLLGGGGHRTGEHPEAGRYELLRQTARRYWPDCHVAAA